MGTVCSNVWQYDNQEGEFADNILVRRLRRIQAQNHNTKLLEIAKADIQVCLHWMKMACDVLHGGVVAQRLHNVDKRLNAAQERLLVDVLVVIVQQNLMDRDQMLRKTMLLSCWHAVFTVVLFIGENPMAGMPMSRR